MSDDKAAMKPSVEGKSLLSLLQICEDLQASTPKEEIQFFPGFSFPTGKTGSEYVEGKALAMPYTDVRFTQKRLDKVVGPFNWQTQTVERAGSLFVRLGIRHPETGEWIWKTDTGVDGGKNNFGSKADMSQGLKRAGYQWGIARDIYDLKTSYFKCTMRKKSGDQKYKFSKWLVDPATGLKNDDPPDELPLTVDDVRAITVKYAVDTIGMRPQDADEWVKEHEAGAEITMDFYRELFVTLTEMNKANQPPE